MDDFSLKRNRKPLPRMMYERPYYTHELTAYFLGGSTKRIVVQCFGLPEVKAQGGTYWMEYINEKSEEIKILSIVRIEITNSIYMGDRMYYGYDPN